MFACVLDPILEACVANFAFEIVRIIIVNISEGQVIIMTMVCMPSVQIIFDFLKLFGLVLYYFRLGFRKYVVSNLRIYLGKSYFILAVEG
jgi:hypothetical protein